MNSVLKSVSLYFNPIKFLELKNLREKDKEALTSKLLEKISEYLVIRTVEILPDGFLSEDLAPEKLFHQARKSVPDYNKKLNSFLEDFKKAFQNNLSKNA